MATNNSKPIERIGVSGRPRAIQQPKKNKSAEYDRQRHALQAPLSCEKCCVLYIKNGREHRSPWYYSVAIGRRALELMRRRYGRAILFRD